MQQTLLISAHFLLAMSLAAGHTPGGSSVQEYSKAQALHMSACALYV
jgi:hypothetical protein